MSESCQSRDQVPELPELCDWLMLTSEIVPEEGDEELYEYAYEHLDSSRTRQKQPYNGRL